VLLAGVTKTSSIVASTSKRSEKTAALAELILSASDEEIEPLIGILIGEPRQGALGVGWASVDRVQATPAAKPTLDLLHLDSTLSLLKTSTGPGSQRRRDSLLEDLLSLATPEEQSFINRLLVGELRQGALGGLVTDAVAKAAHTPQKLTRRAVMLSGNLGAATRIALLHGSSGLENVGLRVLRPVQPMLASSAQGVHEAIEQLGTSSVEWKLDGIRIQLHRSAETVRIFTRNLNEVTERLPEVVARARELLVTDVVLDGEVIGDASQEAPEAFQETMSRFGTQDSDRHSLSLAPRFFDILHRDGRDLIDEPVSVRRTQLIEVVGDLAVPGVLTSSPEVAEGVLQDALDAGHEGVMVKDADSLYEAGRRGKTWRKVKPVHTFDLVVLAVEWGHGRREGKLSNLHLGARADDGPGFVMVGKTFKGMTDAMLDWQTQRFLSLEVSRVGHVVEVEPEQVVEVAIDGVQHSTRYPGGLALRFARVKTYRDDKISSRADTISSLRDLL
jgi:DNA ligase 1